MADPDCVLCELVGYRSCDRCGGVVFKVHPLLGDLCAYCIEDVQAPGPHVDGGHIPKLKSDGES